MAHTRCVENARGAACRELQHALPPNAAARKHKACWPTLTPFALASARKVRNPQECGRGGSSAGGARSLRPTVPKTECSGKLPYFPRTAFQACRGDCPQAPATIMVLWCLPSHTATAPLPDAACMWDFNENVPPDPVHMWSGSELTPLGRITKAKSARSGLGLATSATNTDPAGSRFDVPANSSHGLPCLPDSTSVCFCASHRPTYHVPRFRWPRPKRNPNRPTWRGYQASFSTTAQRATPLPIPCRSNAIDTKNSPTNPMQSTCERLYISNANCGLAQGSADIIKTTHGLICPAGRHPKRCTTQRPPPANAGAESSPLQAYMHPETLRVWTPLTSNLRASYSRCAMAQGIASIRSRRPPTCSAHDPERCMSHGSWPAPLRRALPPTPSHYNACLGIPGARTTPTSDGPPSVAAPVSQEPKDKLPQTRADSAFEGVPRAPMPNMA